MEKSGSNFKIENNILKGNEVPYQSSYPSFGQFVLDQLEKNADSVSQIDAVTGEEYTYKKTLERSIRCALWMKSQGLLAGDVVAICSHNHLDVPIACFAALYLGAAFSLWDDGLNTTEFGQLLSLVKPRIAVFGDKSAARLAEAAREASPDLKIIVLGRVPGFLEFESVIAKAGGEEIKNFSCVEIETLENIASITFTSGTTGLPKGIALSNKAWLRRLASKNKIGVVGRYRSVGFGSTNWISWIRRLFVNLASNITGIIPPPYNEYAACAIIEKYKPRELVLPPFMVDSLLKSHALEKYDLSSLEHVIYGGAGLAVSSQDAFAKFVPNALITGAYGVTEVGGLFSSQTVSSKPNSCGQIIVNAQLKVIDPNTGETMGPGRMGELLLKTDSMASFYCIGPNTTADIVDGEGWYHSGDFGYYDEDGEIFVLDRLTELIKFRGYQVSPTEIENVILSHPGVKDVAVVSVHHPVDGEHPVAFVVRAEDSTGADKQVNEMELVKLVAAKLSDSKQLRGGVRFIDRIRKSPLGKTQRKELYDLLLAESNMAKLGRSSEQLSV